MNESLIVETIQKSTTRWTMLILVGIMMIFLVPMIAEKADALTTGFVQLDSLLRVDKFSNVKGTLDAGKWRQTPQLVGNGWGIEWVTTGSGVFGGDEKGRISADLGGNKHVTLHWSNPARGDNTCSGHWTGPINSIRCSISDGPIAKLNYIVDIRR
jgi:hypothetical protein